MLTSFANAFMVSVMSQDHPGIVAAVSQAIVDLEGNILACSQTVLSGYFTLILKAEFQTATEPDAIVAAIHHTAGASVQVLARPFDEAVQKADAAPPDRFVVMATGSDRPGVIHSFTDYLASKDINIIDLYGDRTGDEFVLIAQVEVPPGWPVGMIQADLEELGREADFLIRFQHENIFVATNQLRLPASRPL